MSGKYQGVIYQPVFISILPRTGKDLNFFLFFRQDGYNFFSGLIFLG